MPDLGFFIFKKGFFSLSLDYSAHAKGQKIVFLIIDYINITP